MKFSTTNLKFITTITCQPSILNEKLDVLKTMTIRLRNPMKLGLTGESVLKGDVRIDE